MDTLLKSLLSSGKAKPRHKWQDLVDLILDHGIMKISAKGLTIPLHNGSRYVNVDGGWTEEHYQLLASLLEPSDKARLARAVLENELTRAGCQELDTAWWLHCRMHGPNEDEWLPRLVEVEGFTAIAEHLTRAVQDYQASIPRPRFVVDVPARCASWKGQTYRVSEEQALFLDLLYRNLRKAPLTERACMAVCPRLEGGHFRRNLWTKLPKPLRDITMSRQGYGWWLQLD